jgi:ABC-type sugar transport system permease subunit
MARWLEAHPRTPVRRSHTGGRWLRRTVRQPQFWFGTAVLVPTLLWYLIFQFGPVLESFYFSVIFVRILDLFGGHFVGLRNYSELLFDPALWTFVPPLLYTVLWVALQAAFVVPLALLTAACLTTITRGRTAYQIVLFLPFITPVVVASQIMAQFFTPQAGLAGAVLRAVGLSAHWLGDPAVAGTLGTYTGVWRWLGFYTVLLTAGMLNIPREVTDAARVDGAQGWALFRRITLPLNGHIMMLVLLLLLINSVQESTLGIANAPMVTAAIANIAFNAAMVQIGMGSAGGVIVCVATLAVSLLIIKLFRPTWSY